MRRDWAIHGIRNLAHLPIKGLKEKIDLLQWVISKANAQAIGKSSITMMAYLRLMLTMSFLRSVLGLNLVLLRGFCIYDMADGHNQICLLSANGRTRT